MRDDGVTVNEKAAGGGDVTVVEPTACGDGDDLHPNVAGYDLLRVLGRGGMGVVWEALEHRFDRRVALKVHARGKGAIDDNELWKEAFVAAKIGDPSIVRVLDVGFTVDERPYYAMELVDGTDLHALIAEGPLPARRSIAIAADVARAAAAAHAHGVIHRDLKPRNVIVDGTDRARVVDFGIAFDSRGGADPFAGRLAGSPAYMAPEQAVGDPVSPQTDIFALGVILYEMLTGRRPFVGTTTNELLAAIILAEAPPPSTLRPDVHKDLDAVVMRCLSREPQARYGSARALFETLSAILDGAVVAVEPPSVLERYKPRMKSSMPPSARPRREDAKKHLSWSWRLRASPQALWPYVANTDRFNKAIGMAPVQFTDDMRGEGDVERVGETRVFGMHIRWREYPFEWVKDRAHSVFRWYRAGPIEALWSRVTLIPVLSGGTELRHDVWVTPRGIVGQVASFVELDRKLGPAIDRFYRHLDDVLASSSGVDPFEPAHDATTDQRHAVERACRRLHGAGFDPKIVEKLAMHLLTAPTGVLTSLRPLELADAWATDRSETLDAFLHAARAGILEPEWDVICPKCMLAHESQPELARVTRVGTCKACASAFERDLGESVELVFIPHPSVRRVDRATYCAGAPAKRPHVVAQQVLDPSEEREVTMTLPRGTYRVSAVAAQASFELVASAVGFETTCAIVVEPGRVDGRPPVVRAGDVTLILRNATDVEETIRVEVPGARDDGVSASTALTHPSFRSFFSDQLLATGEHLRVSRLSFLYIELSQRDGVFERLGDADACAELTRMDERVQQVAQENEGTLVPSSLDILVVAFATPTRALRAALALRAAFEAQPLAAPVAIAAHHGSCIALTREGKPEYFGETLHRGQALLRECPVRGIALTAAFASDRAIAVALHESGLDVRVTKAAWGAYAGRRITTLAPDSAADITGASGPTASS